MCVTGSVFTCECHVPTLISLRKMLVLLIFLCCRCWRLLGRLCSGWLMKQSSLSGQLQLLGTSTGPGRGAMAVRSWGLAVLQHKGQGLVAPGLKWGPEPWVGCRESLGWAPGPGTHLQSLGWSCWAAAPPDENGSFLPALHLLSSLTIGTLSHPLRLVFISDNAFNTKRVIKIDIS